MRFGHGNSGRDIILKNIDQGLECLSVPAKNRNASLHLDNIFASLYRPCMPALFIFYQIYGKIPFLVFGLGKFAFYLLLRKTAVFHRKNFDIGSLFDIFEKIFLNYIRK